MDLAWQQETLAAGNPCSEQRHEAASWLLVENIGLCWEVQTAEGQEAK